SDGTFVLSGLSAQVYTLEVSAPGLVGAEQAGVEVAAGATVSGADFSLVEGGSVSGTITSAADGSPGGGVNVTLQDAQAQFSDQTDASGNFQIAGLPPGTYALTTSNESYMTTTASVIVVAGSNTPVSLVVDPLGSISGTVTAAGGQPLASVVVSVD